MTVGKLADRSMHQIHLPISGINVWIVKDCYGNDVVSLIVAEALLAEMNYPFEEIEWCQITDELEEN
jgi:hypothetical protein